MYVKIENTKNGYILDDLTTSDEFGKLLKNHKKVKCIICNKTTAKRIKEKYLFKMWFNRPNVTIRKSLENGEIYINGCF